MTQEEKQLLLIDLCGRIPHRVKIKRSNCPINLSVIGVIGENVHHIPYYVGGNIAITTTKIDEVKPYLRPLSSMTEEERKEYFDFRNQELQRVAFAEIGRESAIAEISDWLNSHQFDYRGLIPMGLALEAPENMYKTE